MSCGYAVRRQPASAHPSARSPTHRAQSSGKWQTAIAALESKRDDLTNKLNDTLVELTQLQETTDAERCATCPEAREWPIH